MHTPEERVVVMQGEVLNLRVYSAVSSPVDSHWTFTNGSLAGVSLGNSGWISEDQHTLSIPSVQFEHSGNYTLTIIETFNDLKVDRSVTIQVIVYGEQCYHGD